MSFDDAAATAFVATAAIVVRRLGLSRGPAEHLVAAAGLSMFAAFIWAMLNDLPDVRRLLGSVLLLLASNFVVAVGVLLGDNDHAA